MVQKLARGHRAGEQQQRDSVPFPAVMPHCLPLPGSPLCFRATQFCLRQEKKAGKKENSVREAGGAPWGVCTPWHGLWDAARAERPVGTRLPPAPRGTEGQLALGQGDRRAWRLRTVDTPRPNPGPEKPPTEEEKHVSGTAQSPGATSTRRQSHAGNGRVLRRRPQGHARPETVRGTRRHTRGNSGVSNGSGAPSRACAHSRCHCS